MVKNVVLFSSGLDSLAALFWARRQYGKENVLALYCDVGHRYAEKEIRAVKEICQILNQEYIIDSRLNLSCFEKPKEQNSIIPYRNTFFILIAASHLPEDGGNIIIQNVIQGESTTIDRRAIFNQKLKDFLPFADNREVDIIAPHQDWTKGQICYMLKNVYGCPDELMLKTIGCYSHEPGNCGECNSCFRSWIALEHANVQNARSRYTKDPSKWTDGVNDYIQKMFEGKYEPKRVNETFAVLRKYGIKIPSRIYVFDLDGVITIKPKLQDDIENGTVQLNIDELRECYKSTKPNQKAIEKMKQIALHRDKIIIHTARHETDRDITMMWLNIHNVPYDELIMGKPHGHFYIDDKSVNLEDI